MLIREPSGSRRIPVIALLRFFWREDFLSGELLF
jgi:hypothetical protein